MSEKKINEKDVNIKDIPKVEFKDGKAIVNKKEIDEFEKNINVITNLDAKLSKDIKELIKIDPQTIKGQKEIDQYINNLPNLKPLKEKDKPESFKLYGYEKIFYSSLISQFKEILNRNSINKPKNYELYGKVPYKELIKEISEDLHWDKKIVEEYLGRHEKANYITLSFEIGYEKVKGKIESLNPKLENLQQIRVMDIYPENPQEFLKQFLMHEDDSIQITNYDGSIIIEGFDKLTKPDMNDIKLLSNEVKDILSKLDEKESKKYNEGITEKAINVVKDFNKKYPISVTIKKIKGYYIITEVKYPFDIDFYNSINKIRKSLMDIHVKYTDPNDIKYGYFSKDLFIDEIAKDLKIERLIVQVFLDKRYIGQNTFIGRFNIIDISKTGESIPSLIEEYIKESKIENSYETIKKKSPKIKGKETEEYKKWRKGYITNIKDIFNDKILYTFIEIYPYLKSPLILDSDSKNH